eukprot:Clim_evm6s90 gene=Clim_evmTU6s90
MQNHVGNQHDKPLHHGSYEPALHQGMHRAGKKIGLKFIPRLLKRPRLYRTLTRILGRRLLRAIPAMLPAIGGIAGLYLARQDWLRLQQTRSSLLKEIEEIDQPNLQATVKIEPQLFTLREEDKVHPAHPAAQPPHRREVQAAQLLFGVALVGDTLDASVHLALAAHGMLDWTPPSTQATDATVQTGMDETGSVPIHAVESTSSIPGTDITDTIQAMLHDPSFLQVLHAAETSSVMLALTAGISAVAAEWLVHREESKI